MDSQTTQEIDRIRQLAQSVDCLTEPDLCLLAKATPNTVESWRKRGIGPAYVLIGNRFLYPRQAVVEYIASNVRERRSVPARSVL